MDSTEYTEEKVTGLLRVDRAALQKVTVMVPDKTDKNTKDTKNTGSFDAEEENEEEVEQVEQVVTRLMAIPTNHSNQGVSLSTLSLSGLSKADQERLFTMMLREIDGTTIRSNGKLHSPHLNGFVTRCYPMLPCFRQQNLLTSGFLSVCSGATQILFTRGALVYTNQYNDAALNIQGVDSVAHEGECFHPPILLSCLKYM